MEPRVDPAPMDVDAVPVVAAGTALFALAFLVLLPFHSSLDREGRRWWIWAAAWGVALGLIGLRHCARRRAAIARAESGEADTHPA